MKKLLIIFSILLCSAQAKAVFDVTVTDHLRVWAEFPDKIIADGETINYIKVYQHDDDDLDYTAFNMEFILPEGFRINKVKQGRETVNDIFLSERATSTHTIACNIVDGVDLRIFCDSSMNSDLYKDDEEGNPLDLLFTVGLIAESTIPTGEYTVQMLGIKFCHSNADAKIPAADPTNYQVYIQGDKPAGIEEVVAEELDLTDCYDLNGRRINIDDAHGIIVVCRGRKFYLK